LRFWISSLPSVVSTATGRQEAMTLVHAVATSPDHAVAPAVEALADPEASGQALRHVLVGGVHSVEDFAAEMAEAEGGVAVDLAVDHHAVRVREELGIAVGRCHDRDHGLAFLDLLASELGASSADRSCDAFWLASPTSTTVVRPGCAGMRAAR